MKYIISFLSLGLVLFATGCNNSSDKDDKIVTPEVQTVQAADSNEAFQPAQTGSAITSPAAATTPQLNTVATGALNPEHGKPGHRCDIAVGAPLDSKPTAPATVVPTTTTSSTIIPTTTKPTTAPAVSGSNLNPEHGKPGHRCDIAVGASLDGAPAKAAVTTQPTVTTVPVAQQKTGPITPVLPTTSTTVAPGMNPEHGKPGHRCDIAVGAPLSGAPKQ